VVRRREALQSDLDTCFAILFLKKATLSSWRARTGRREMIARRPSCLLLAGFLQARNRRSPGPRLFEKKIRPVPGGALRLLPQLGAPKLKGSLYLDSRRGC